MVGPILTAILVWSMGTKRNDEIRLSGLLPGVHLATEIKGLQDAEPISYEIQLRSGRSTKPRAIHTLNDLVGYVRISSTKEALDFVRLRTSRSTWDLCWNGDLEAEVTSASLSRRAANYGIVPDEIAPKFEGWLGVLSDRQFKRSNVEPAQVKREGRGFIVTRSILVNVGWKFKYIEEHVGPDGSYWRNVLKSVHAPRGSDYNW